MNWRCRGHGAAQQEAAAAADAETATLIDAMAADAANTLWEDADEQWCCPFVPSVAGRVERLIEFLRLDSRDVSERCMIVDCSLLVHQLAL